MATDRDRKNLSISGKPFAQIAAGMMALGAGALAALIGGGHLAAWLSGAMTERGFSAITMKTNAALCLLLLGLALILLALRQAGALGRWTGRACATLALMIGALTLSQHLAGWDLAIDQLLAGEPGVSLATTAPNRMGPTASTCFVLAGVALLLLSRREGRHMLTAQALALAICLISLLPTIGYLYGVRALFGVARTTGIAWPTAVALLLLGVGLLCARPAGGLMAQVTAAGPGGSILRRLLLSALLLPIGLGWLHLAGERAGHYDTPMGTALLMLAFIVILSMLAYFAGRQVSRSTAEIARHEETLAVTLTSIGDAVIASDTGGRVTFLNPVAESLTGWKSEEALSRPIAKVFQIINEKTRQPAEDIMDVVLREKRIVALANHTALVTRDGREIPIEDSAAPILSKTGDLTGVVLVFHDVTEKRRAQEELRSVALFPEENPNPVLRIATSGRLLYANTAAREKLGNAGWREGQPLPEPFTGIVAQSWRAQTMQEMEFMCHDKRIFSFMVAPILDRDYANLYGRDITERMQAEEDVCQQREWLRVTLSSIGDAVLASDAQGLITFLNPIAETLTGWPNDEALGQPVTDIFKIINEKTRQSAEDIVARVLRERRVIALANHTALATRDGREIPIEDSAAPILDAAGQVIGAVLVFHDVTERRRVQEALRESNEELTLFNRVAVGRELRMIELKNEVNGLCAQAGQPLRYPFDSEEEQS